MINRSFAKEIEKLFDTKIYVFLSLEKFLELELPQAITNIVVLTVDHWGDDEHLYSPEALKPASIIDNVLAIASANPSKNFYFTTCCPFVFHHFDDVHNVKIIHWGDDFLFHPKTNYKNLQPVVNKKFEQDWHWIYLSNNPRMHRIICALFLLGSEIHGGHVRFDDSSLTIHDSWQTFAGYLTANQYKYLDSIDSTTTQALSLGFEKTKALQGFEKNNFKEQSWVNNIQCRLNFENNLRDLYTHSVVDIIAETVFISNTGIITEKYLNSVYGWNFPILISMPGVVTYLRSLGFDMFDDVINHNYDNIQDPYTRMIVAVESNRTLLSNKQFAIDCWHQCKSRFRSNFDMIESMYQNRWSTALNKIKSAILPMPSTSVN